MVFAGFFISSARYVAITVESIPPPEAVFVTGNFDVSGATLMYKDQLVVTPTDIEFETDGTKLFVAVEGSTSIYEYSISNAWDLTTVSADATTSLSVSNLTRIQTIDFNRSGTKMYACGSGNVAEFSMTSAYDLTTAGSQSTLDISAYSGQIIYGACFSNSESNNYLHFTSSAVNHVNTISTIKIEEPLSGSTFIGRSANVVPLINTMVAPDLHTTRTLEVSGGGSRFYQIYRNTDLSNVHVIEFKLGTPHDASTLTSVTQIEDYFDLATQTGGTTLYDTFNSLKIKPDGSEMFLSGTNFFNTTLSSTSGVSTTMGHNRDLTYVTGRAVSSSILYIYKYDESSGTFGLDQSISSIDGNSIHQGEPRISNDGTLLIATRPGDSYFTINQYNGSTWSTLQKYTINSSRVGEDGIDLSTSENLIVIGSKTLNRFYVSSNNAGTWSLTTYNMPGSSGPRSISITDESVLAIGDSSNVFHGAGVIHLYSNVGGTWTLGETIVAPDSGTTNFAVQGAMELNGDSTVIVVGAHAYSSFKGRVYVYEKSGGSWALYQTIDNPNGTAADQFGDAVSINSNGDKFIASAPVYSSSKGRVYVFDKIGTTWTLTNTIDTPTSGKRFGDDLQLSWDGNRLAAQETSTMRYYTSPKNTQTYSLDIPTPVLYISGEQDSVFDQLNGLANVDVSGTSSDFERTTSVSKTGTYSIDIPDYTSNIFIPSSSISQLNETNDYHVISMWIYMTALTGYNAIFSSYNYAASPSQGGYSVIIQNDYKIYVYGKNSTGTSAFQYNASAFTSANLLNQWHHVVAVIPIVAKTSNTPFFYINGEYKSSVAGSGISWINLGFPTNEDYYVGGHTSFFSTTFKIDEVKVFNTLLPEKTINKIYLDGLAPGKTQAFHLTFEDNTGADILPSGASLGGTSLATLQSNTVTYQGDYVGDFTVAESNVSLQNWNGFASPFTVSFWYHHTGLIHTSGGTVIYSSELYVTSGFWLYIYDTTDPHRIYFFAYNGSSSINTTTSANNYLDNQWNHFVMRLSPDNYVKIYLNGVEIISLAMSTSFLTATQDLHFMKGYPFSPTDPRRISGYLDDLRVYDYALDPKEIEYLYTATLIHKDQTFYLSYDQSNVYEYHAGTTDVTATGTGVYYQDPGSKIGTHSGRYQRASSSDTRTIVPVWSGLTTATALTISCWLFCTDDTINTYDYPFSTEDYLTSQDGFMMQVAWLSTPRISLYTKSSNSQRYQLYNITNLSELAKNKWIHVVAVYGSSIWPYSFLYVNGEKMTISSSSGTMALSTTVGKGLVIGNYHDSINDGFEGAIDDFRVLKRALNDQEATAMYRQYTQSRIYTLNVS